MGDMNKERNASDLRDAFLGREIRLLPGPTDGSLLLLLKRLDVLIQVRDALLHFRIMTLA
jgi:hypothetical protein